MYVPSSICFYIIILFYFWWGGCLANWHPLVDTFGAYNAKSPTNGVPFSQMKSKKFEHIFKDDSWIMVTRTSKKKKVLEFPVARRGSWKRGERMEKIKTLRMGNNQHGDGKIRDYSGKVNVFQGCKHPCYSTYLSKALPCRHTFYRRSSRFGSRLPTLFVLCMLTCTLCLFFTTSS